MLKKKNRPARTLSRKQTSVVEGASQNQPDMLFKHLFESAPEAQVLVNSNGVIVAANVQSELLFGYRRDEMIGQFIELLVPHEYREVHRQHREQYIRAPYNRSASTVARPVENLDYQPPAMGVGHLDSNSLNSGRVQLELTALCKDGSIFPAEITLNPIWVGDTLYVLSVVRDITIRYQREQALTEQSELIRLLQDVAIAANEANSINDAFQFVTDRLCKHLNWPVGHALLTEEDQALSSTNIWNRNMPDQFTEFRRATEMLRFQPGFGLPGSVLNSSQPVWMTDIVDHPQFARPESARAVGLSTGLAMPVLAGRSVVGVLEFFHTESIPTDPRLLAVLPHIGVQLGRVVERKRAEEAQRKSAAQLRMVMTNLPVFLWVMDRQGKLILLEGRGVSSLEIKPESLLGKSVFDLSAERPDFIELIKRALAGETIHSELPSESGSTFETFFTPYYDANWAVDGVIGLSFDVSERKRMESELDEMKHRLMASIETERAHLGQQIHDGPLQDLYGAFYQIQEVKSLLAEGEQETANRALNTLQNVSATLRMICGELHPSILVHLGLKKSIRSHAEQLQERLQETTIHLDLADENAESGRPISSSMKLALFRVYQSLIGNAARHAQARHVWVRLRLPPEQVVLEVQDNGIGYEPPEHWISLIREGKVGLVSTLERVEGMGGKMDIHAKPGKGTLVRVTVPR